MTDGTTMALLIESAKLFGPFAVIIVALIMMISMTLRYHMDKQMEKSDKDRDEHMNKWNTMTEANRESMIVMTESSRDSMRALANAQRDSVASVIKANDDNLERMFKLYERNAQATEALSHSVALITDKMKSHKLCPVEEKKA